MVGLCLPNQSFPQLSPPLGDILFDVSFIHLDSCYTKAQILALWGEPRTYHQHESEFGLDESYYYGKNGFEFNKGYMTLFSLADQMFSIFNNHIPGGIKVGDPVTQFNQLIFGKLHFKGKAGEFYFQIGDADDVIQIIADENNLIIEIYYILHV